VNPIPRGYTCRRTRSCGKLNSRMWRRYLLPPAVLTPANTKRLPGTNISTAKCDATVLAFTQQYQRQTTRYSICLESDYTCVLNSKSHLLDHLTDGLTALYISLRQIHVIHVFWDTPCTLVFTVTPSLPLLGSGYQRRVFPSLWVPELSQCLSYSNFLLTPLRWQSLCSLNCPDYDSSGLTAKKTTFLCCCAIVAFLSIAVIAAEPMLFLI
jgi:hypothetical protein